MVGVLLRLGDNICQILSPNLHSCASLGNLFLPAKKKHPQNRFFGVFWVEIGAFWGVKSRRGGSTPIWVNYHPMGAQFERNASKYWPKKCENKKRGGNTYLILVTFGDIWWPDCLPTVPHLFKTGVSTKREVGRQRYG